MPVAVAVVAVALAVAVCVTVAAGAAGVGLGRVAAPRVAGVAALRVAGRVAAFRVAAGCVGGVLLAAVRVRGLGDRLAVGVGRRAVGRPLVSDRRDVLAVVLQA